MSSVNCCSSDSEKSDNSEVGGFCNSNQKEALKEMIMHIMQHELKPDIEGLVRDTVREEFRNLLNGLDRNSGYQVQTSEPRHLKLQFLKNVSLPVFTNEEIQGEGPSSIEVALIDNLDEKVVDSGPEASAKVEIVALEGDVGGTQGDDWASEEFNEKIVREREGAYSKGKEKRREGKKPLLDGDVHLRLNKGIGAIGKIKFRQYQCWMKNRKFKLGARILDAFAGVRIKEAVTKPFIVKDRRNKCERKRGPPSLLDDVSKLKNIRKNSKRHRHLQEKNINTVEDFLIQHFRDPEHLEQILGLEANLCEDTVSHARKCALDKRISYYYSSQEKLGVVFNVIEQILGLISECKYSPIEDRSEKEKADARRLAIIAFDNWEDVIHFHDMNSLFEYVHNLPATEETSNPPKLQIPGGDCTSTSGSNVENIHSPNSSSMNSLMEFVENYFRQQQKAQLSWKKLSIAVRISMKKW